MNIYDNKTFTGERAIYKISDVEINNSIFEDGESPIKECNNIVLNNCEFRWKYPVWYSNKIAIKNSKWDIMGRAGVWYTNDVTVEDSIINAPKNFRRCNNLSITRCSIPNAEETLWSCSNVNLSEVTVTKGDYFGMNCKDLVIDKLDITGNYTFDGVSNMTISNSRLISKDAFWNTENVTVKNCYISGEYLGWNSKNLTLIDCEIESLQGMCYIDNLKLINCRLVNTTLAFEYCTVEADIKGNIDSVFNPVSGCIKADSIKELIIEKDLVQPDKTIIICDNIETKSDKPEWKR